MSRITLPSEKIVAVVGIYRALLTELVVSDHDPRVQVALIDAATRIALATDTRDMGILAQQPPPKRDGEANPHTSGCVCPWRPWCEDHDTVEGTLYVCSDHEHHEG